jgi:hypothetical protein
MCYHLCPSDASSLVNVDSDTTGLPYVEANAQWPEGYRLCSVQVVLSSLNCLNTAADCA